MRFGASRSQLYDAQKSARGRWDAVGEVWSDSAARDFGEQVWQPFDDHVSELLKAIDAMTVVFTQVRQDCEFGSH
jgi:hypothetical protein